MIRCCELAGKFKWAERVRVSKQRGQLCWVLSANEEIQFSLDSSLMHCMQSVWRWCTLRSHCRVEVVFNYSTIDSTVRAASFCDAQFQISTPIVSFTSCTAARCSSLCKWKNNSIFVHTHLFYLLVMMNLNFIKANSQWKKYSTVLFHSSLSLFNLQNIFIGISSGVGWEFIWRISLFDHHRRVFSCTIFCSSG